HRFQLLGSSHSPWTNTTGAGRSGWPARTGRARVGDRLSAGALAGGHAAPPGRGERPRALPVKDPAPGVGQRSAAFGTQAEAVAEQRVVLAAADVDRLPNGCAARASRAIQGGLPERPECTGTWTP